MENNEFICACILDGGIIDELKLENEQLKTKVFKLESKQTSMGEQNKELIEDNLNLSKENERLSTTLTEIKEIAEPIYEDYSRRWDDNVTEVLEQILQKISEVME